MKRFTIIELLVVIVIISILISILLPSLMNARRKTKIAVCLNNQKQIGIGLVGYMGDSNSKYPVHHDWATILGKTGSDSQYYFGTWNENDRPLNNYIGSVEVAKCPSDLGDSAILNGTRVKNCFNSYGNSYLVQFKIKTYGVDFVTSDNINATKSQMSIEYPDKKVVMGDWPRGPWRRLEKPQSRWHSENKRRYNTLFADGHAKFYNYPLAMESWNIGIQPDPSRGFY